MLLSKKKKKRNGVKWIKQTKIRKKSIDWTRGNNRVITQKWETNMTSLLLFSPYSLDRVSKLGKESKIA